MKLVSTFVSALAVAVLAAAAPVLAALPSVTSFTVAATAVSPVPVSTFSASDSDGTVVGYMITQTSTKPSASDSRWRAASWTSYATTSTGSLTLYAWAKDNANGVSNSRSASVNVVGGHLHTLAQVTGLTTALAEKADVNHDHDAAYARKGANVLVVAQDGTGDFTSPVDAMNAITGADAAHPYLVKIMPGVYNIGSGSVQMKEYVDIEGSGENVTKILGNTSTHYPEASVGLVMGANNAELRSLTVENIGPGSENMSIAIMNVSVSPRISNVTVVTRNGQTWSIGVWNDINASPRMDNLTVSAFDGGWACEAVANYSGSAPVIRNSTIFASGNGPGTEMYGMYNGESGTVQISDTTITTRGGSARSMGIHNSWNSSLVLTNVTISAPDPAGQAIWNYGSTNALIVIDRCTLEGATNSIANSGDDVRVGASKLIGPAVGATCVGAYDGTLTPLNASCQP